MNEITRQLLLALWRIGGIGTVKEIYAELPSQFISDYKFTTEYTAKYLYIAKRSLKRKYRRKSHGVGTFWGRPHQVYMLQSQDEYMEQLKNESQY